MKNKKKRPPKIASWLLEKMVDESIRYSAMGDFEERFYTNIAEKGIFAATILYWYQLILVLPTSILYRIFWRIVMFRNYLKIALRQIKKYKVYTFINISGLAVGMACYLLINLFVQYELSYDNFHESADSIYRIQRGIGGNNSGRANASVITYGPLASALVTEYPEIINAVRIEHRDEYVIAIQYENNRFYERGFYVDECFFDIFSYNLIKGNAKTALVDPFSMVITEKLAKKYFGNEEPMGKTLTFMDDGSYNAKITGIIKEIPKNSHLQFDFLLSIVSLNTINDNENFGQTWPGSDFLTYVELEENINYKDLETKLPALIERFEDRENSTYYLLPVKDIHLKSRDNFEILKNRDLQNIHFLSLVAYLILIIACINYLNLATAKALKRSKEIGVRKVIGAFRKQLILQFLYESLVLSAIALVFAALVTAAALPMFNVLTNREISISFFDNINLLPGLVGLVVIVGLFSGIYPAIHISSLQPVKALSGKYDRSSGKSRLRNTSVTFQFCVSIMLITGTLIVVRQLDYIRTTDIGYDREQVLAMQIRDDVIHDNLESLKTELLKNPAIRAVSSSSHIPNRITWGGSLISKDNETIRTNSCAVDIDYVDLFDIDIIEGRNFSRDFTSDRNGAFLLNETAVKSLGWESPLGMECSHWGMKTGKVVGIFRDFHYRSLHSTIRPQYLVLYPERVRVLFVKIESGDIQNAVRFIGETIESFNPSHPFDYFFLDDSFNDMYKSEQQFGTIIISFSSLSIFIACLGLLGLISFSTEIRTREIGIRKVLGASIVNVLKLITKEYLLLIAIAAFIAWPVAYLILNSWLRNFAYKIKIGWDVFLLSGLIVIVIALLTVSYQSLKTARANPVDSLKYE